MNSISINGLNIETNKPGISLSGEVAVFGDGSTYNTRTGAFNNAGPGYVIVNGKRLENSEGDSQKSRESAVKTRSEDVNATNLSLKLTTAHVTVEKRDRPGMHVEITGPSDLVEAVKLSAHGTTLHIEEVSTGGNHSTVTIGNGNVVMSSFGGSAFIGGVQIGGGRGGVSINRIGGVNALSVKVLVPSGTPITVTSVAGDVDIHDVAGPLSVGIKGSADVTATNASGNVQINIAGSGDVRVGNGDVASLSVSIAGSGDVRFGGIAQNAMLSVAGSGDISVDHVVNPPMRSVAGSGRIRVGKVGQEF